MNVKLDDPYNLERFVDAQQHVIASVTAELTQGRKRSHWMWFIFPQLKGLGHTAQSNFFGILSLQEAAAYLQHPVLGPRLQECTQLVNAVEGHSAENIFGAIDAMKFRSSMTLFAKATPANAAPENQIFIDALEKYFAGELDPLTLGYLGQQRL
ncbi:MAG: calpastatin [Acidobacteriaceae bacterium]|nr:calpastatin [Acidobacteriaceae bacterium]